jgi:pimeloyl-ACP methyl ester carboxylesterase
MRTLLTAFADAMSLRRFAVAGIAMGGGVAWLCASQDPERIAALILVDAAGWPLAPPEELPLAFRILQYRLGRWLLARIDNTPLIVQGLKQNVVDATLINP